jgi:gas vesicle protein
VEAIIGGIVGLVVGAAATNLVTGLASSTGNVLRGVAKEVIKGGLIIQEAASDMFSGGGNYFSDIVTEAKAELESTPARESMPAKAHSHK